MNKTVNINLAGIFFHIDEDAYLKLQGYLTAIKNSFANTEGSAEIIADIETRISELFNERLKNERQVIGLKEVEEVIAIMGQPEDYLVDDDIFEDEPRFNSSKKSTLNKKLFRDIDNSYISGVSSGFAHYLGIDPIWMRLLWVLLVMMSFGTFVVIYILFWILIPAAKTTAEKIMMTGEPVNINNIEKQIKDSFETVSGVAKNVSKSVSDTAKKHGGAVKKTSKNFFDTIADFIMVVVRIFSKFIGIIIIVFSAVILISLILGLFSVGFKNILNIPGLDYVYAFNAGNTPIWLASLLVFFTVGIPVFFLFYLGLKIFVNNLKSIGKIAKLTLLGLWLCAIVGIVIVSVREVSEHSISESVIDKHVLNVTSKDTLRIDIRNNDLYRNHDYNGGFKIANHHDDLKGLYVRNVRIVIKSTKDSLVTVNVEKTADGSSYQKAINYANNIKYDFDFKHQKLMLDSYLYTDVENKFRNQKVTVFVYIPEGVIVNCSESTRFYYTYPSIIENKQTNHYVKIIKDDVLCLDCDDDFKVEVKTPKVKIDEDGVEINGDEGSLKIDKNGIRAESKEVKVRINSDGIDIQSKEN
ncbi:PspC domain-containing protein [Wenyingzhuangia sp. chi5]|uniref:PspC domain-containing protein n=1 Tax=Wenyingzhuangia gilva TaxID=3057677 RepID=A0ABT8VNM5_9FLAO|nr:PspC domain-containing protein [Wenyingzhuangia sp. chi5]MDO3693570.1 PspC domain-containing protein [Wenyingzhuangia sp. chi5]